MNSSRLFAEFFNLQPAEKKRPLEDGSQEWKGVLHAETWWVELQKEGTLARLADRSSHLAVYDTEIALYAGLKRFLRQKAGDDGAIKEKIALVLAGGGAKGAYQIGAWDALRQLGVDRRIGGIAGTSIGAVNTMLIARGEYDYALELWQELSESDRREEDRRRLEQFFQRIPAVGELVLKDRFLTQAALQRALSRTISGGCGERIKERYHVYTAAVRKETWEKGRPEAVYMPWNLLSNAEIIRAALASSAIPLVYNPVEFKGELYYDGGLKDNLPVKPLYQCGYRRFIVIHLQRDGRKVRKVRDRLSQCGCQAVHIVPGPAFEDDMAAMLKLTPEATCQRIDMGRRDALALRDALLQLAAD